MNAVSGKGANGKFARKHGDDVRAKVLSLLRGGATVPDVRRATGVADATIRDMAFEGGVVPKSRRTPRTMKQRQAVARAVKAGVSLEELSAQVGGSRDAIRRMVYQVDPLVVGKAYRKRTSAEERSLRVMAWRLDEDKTYPECCVLLGLEPTKSNVNKLSDAVRRFCRKAQIPYPTSARGTRSTKFRTVPAEKDRAHGLVERERRALEHARGMAARKEP